MFSASINDTKLLRDSIDCIAQLIDEGLFKLGPDGIELVATDRAMVAVVELKLSRSAFDSYNCDSESKISLNLLNFLTVLRRAGPGDRLELKLAENRLDVILTGHSRRSFAIPLLEPSSEEIPPISQLDFPAAAELKAGIVVQGIEDADIIADSVSIELSEAGFGMSAAGDSSRTELELKSGSEALLSLAVKGVVKSRYPLDYLKKMCRAVRVADTVKIQLGQDYPMRIDFCGENVSLSMVLAPRVSEE
jgi:proliferating cell nuclear antigen